MLVIANGALVFNLNGLGSGVLPAAAEEALTVHALAFDHGDDA